MSADFIAYLGLAIFLIVLFGLPVGWIVRKSRREARMASFGVEAVGNQMLREAASELGLRWDPQSDTIRGTLGVPVEVGATSRSLVHSTTSDSAGMSDSVRYKIDAEHQVVIRAFLDPPLRMGLRVEHLSDLRSLVRSPLRDSWVISTRFDSSLDAKAFDMAQATKLLDGNAGNTLLETLAAGFHLHVTDTVVELESEGPVSKEDVVRGMRRATAAAEALIEARTGVAPSPAEALVAKAWEDVARNVGAELLVSAGQLRWEIDAGKICVQLARVDEHEWGASLRLELTRPQPDLDKHPSVEQALKEATERGVEIHRVEPSVVEADYTRDVRDVEQMTDALHSMKTIGDAVASLMHPTKGPYR